MRWTLPLLLVGCLPGVATTSTTTTSPTQGTPSPSTHDTAGPSWSDTDTGTARRTDSGEPPTDTGTGTGGSTTDTATPAVACSADPWPLTDLDASMLVTVLEPQPFAGSDRTTETRGAFSLSPRSRSYGGAQRVVLDPYTGGEDCEWSTWDASLTSIGDVRDLGPATWWVDGASVTVDYHLAYFGHAYESAEWTVLDRPPGYEPISFERPDVSDLYGQPVSLSWAGGPDGTAGSLPTLATVPGPIGVTEPAYAQEMDLADLEVRWTHTEPGAQLRLRSHWNEGNTVYELDCRIDDDGHWKIPADVAALVEPRDRWSFDLQRAENCVRAEPWGSVHAGAVVIAPLRIDPP